ncbi:hypothetical protein ACN9MH_00895 [Paenibacillus silvae]|uniref:hypothetical protein n=1 Tax=Paenibacillus TaxID=44249 RepID=UPI001C124F04|nr:hypothetical protein [Paenibacillus barcinonensis]MBU5355188.1 hypothetical protein [Paenibacillus barcinonensis]
MNMGYFKTELKRAIYSKNTLISAALIYICIFIGTIEYLFQFTTMTNATYLFLMGHSTGTISIISLLFPILVSIPFASSYVSDVQSGFIQYIQTRLEKWKYITVRLLINGLVSGGIISTCLLVSFFFFMLIRGFDVSPSPYINVSSKNELYDLYHNWTTGYILLYILQSFISGVVFSTLGLGLSTFIKNKYFAVLSPFLFYIVSGTLLIQINKFFHSAIIFNLGTYGDLKYSYVVLYTIILLGVGVTLFTVGVLKNDEV